MADYARIMDFAFIAILVMLINKITTRPQSGGDWLGTIFVAWILFAIFKLPYLMAFGGVSFPATKNPVIHMVSAPLSILTLIIVFGCIRFLRCPHRRAN